MIAPPGLHLAIIMDGNGRWAQWQGLPRLSGHRAGIDAVRRTVTGAPGLGITCLTLYAFSSDNWRRPPAEVTGIFTLLCAYLRLEAPRLRRQGVRLKFIGRRDRLSASVLAEITAAEAATSGASRLTLRIALDYSGRDSIAQAAAMALTSTPSRDELRAEIAAALTTDSGDVDLLIRTGGEKRLSDFLLWEAAYAELIFTDRMWPDFSAEDLASAITEFQRRNRRFGELPLRPPPQRSVPSARGSCRDSD